MRDSVARLVDEKVLPVIRECFEQHRFPRELVPELAALGILGAPLEGYGCAGLGAVAYGLISQELERGDSALRSFSSVQTSLCMFPIHRYGSEEQKQRWLPAMARGRGHRLLRAHRIAGRFGSGQHPHACAPPGRGLDC